MKKSHFGKHARFFLLLCLAFWCETCFATSEIFIFTKDGVWFASDTLITHEFRRYTVCKAYLSKNRIMFFTGKFREIDQMPVDMMNLPFGGPHDTMELMMTRLGTNVQDFYPSGTSFLSHYEGGLIQFRDGHLEAILGALGDGLQDWRWKDIDPTKLGIPYGFGTEVDARTNEVLLNPALAAEIARHPKRELLRLLRNEAAQPDSSVGAPFTVLHMKRNGKVVNLSDNQVCPNH